MGVKKRVCLVFFGNFNELELSIKKNNDIMNLKRENYLFIFFQRGKYLFLDK